MREVIRGLPFAAAFELYALFFQMINLLFDGEG